MEEKKVGWEVPDLVILICSISTITIPSIILIIITVMVIGVGVPAEDNIEYRAERTTEDKNTVETFFHQVELYC